MARKRKFTTTDFDEDGSSRKRSKVRQETPQESLPETIEDSQPTDPDENPTDPDYHNPVTGKLVGDYHDLREILDERNIPRRLKGGGKAYDKEYLFQWEGTDPKTGKDWVPQWQPAKNVDEDCEPFQVWIKQKKEKEEKARVEKLKAQAESTPVKSARQKRTPARRVIEDDSSILASSPTPAAAATRRSRRIIESSPAQPTQEAEAKEEPAAITSIDDTYQPSVELSTQPAVAPEGTLTEEEEAHVAPDPSADVDESPQVFVTQNSQFDLAQYEPFPTQPSTQFIEAESPGTSILDRQEDTASTAETQARHVEAESPHLSENDSQDENSSSSGTQAQHADSHNSESSTDESQAAIDPQVRSAEEPQVVVTQDSEFDPAEFVAVSTHPQTQSRDDQGEDVASPTWTPINGGTRRTNLTQSQSSSLVSSPKVVPDTQVPAGSSTYVPSAKTAQNSNESVNTQDLPSPPESPPQPKHSAEQETEGNAVETGIEHVTSSGSSAYSEQARPNTPTRPVAWTSKALAATNGVTKNTSPKKSSPVNENSRRSQTAEAAAIIWLLSSPKLSNDRTAEVSTRQDANHSEVPPETTRTETNNRESAYIGLVVTATNGNGIAATTRAASPAPPSTVLMTVTSTHSRQASRDLTTPALPSTPVANRSVASQRSSVAPTTPKADATMLRVTALGTMTPEEFIARKKWLKTLPREERIAELSRLDQVEYPEEFDETITPAPEERAALSVARYAREKPFKIEVGRIESLQKRKAKEEAMAAAQSASNSPAVSAPSAAATPNKSVQPSVAQYPITSPAVPTRLASETETTRSPSVIPSKAQLEAQSYPLTGPTTLRNAVSARDATDEELEEESQGSTSSDYARSSQVLDEPWIAQNEYLVPLSLESAWIRDCYVDLYKQMGTSFITDYMNNDYASPSHADVEKVNALLDAAQDMTTRYTALDSSDSQARHDPAELAEFWKTHSPKLRFLAEVLRLCASTKLHLAIICKPGPITDLLVAFLKSKRVSYVRPGIVDGSQKSNGQGNITVTLLPTGNESSKAVVRPADLVICWDSTADISHKNFATLRSTVHGDLAPALSLVVIQSVDHIERCVARSAEGVERSKLLLNCTAQLCKSVGAVPEGKKAEDYHAVTHARSVAEFVNKPRDFGTAIDLRDWSKPALPSIADLVTETTNISSEETSDMTVTSSALQGTQEATVTRKRLLEAADDAEATKRSRTGEHSATSETQDVDMTHITDSAGARTQGVAQAAKDAVMTDVPAAQEPASSSSQSELSRLRRQNRDYKATLDDLEKSMEALQARYETQGDSALSSQRAIAEANSEIEQLKGKLEDRNKVIAARDDSIKSLREQLAHTTKLLDSSSDAAQAEAARQLARAETAERENAVTERKLASERQTLEYTREIYQTASNRATELTAEIEALKKEIARLTPLANGNALELQKVNRSTWITKATQQMQTDRSTIEGLENMVREKDDEIKTLRNGRPGVGTRTASVAPRSPKVGPRTGSRASSPLPSTGASRMQQLRGNNFG